MWFFLAFISSFQAHAWTLTRFETANSTQQTFLAPTSNETNATISLGSGFSAQYICAGKKILGISGSAYCSNTTALFSIAPSGALRTDGVSTLPALLAYPASRGTSKLKIGDEYANIAGSTGIIRLVPNPAVDHDDLGNVYGGTPQVTYFITIYGGRPTTDCGNSGSVNDRISDCAFKNSGRNFYDGLRYGKSTEATWTLVSRLTSGPNIFEVWRDDRTNLLWGDRIIGTFSAYNGTQVNTGFPGVDISAFNWYVAAGYSAPDTETTGSGLNGAPATAGHPFHTSNAGGCTFAFGSCTFSLQPSTPISLCADASLINGNNGIATYITPAEANTSKGNIGVAENVKWRLPTINDFHTAYLDGLPKVLPNLSGVFYSAQDSYSGGYPNMSWAFSMRLDIGQTNVMGRNFLQGVRCVGVQP